MLHRFGQVYLPFIKKRTKKTSALKSYFSEDALAVRWLAVTSDFDSNGHLL